MDEISAQEKILRNLYEAIETDLIDSWRHVEPTDDNLDTYSIQFYRLHQDICRAIDSLCKLMLREYQLWPSGKNNYEIRISDYRSLKGKLRFPTEELEVRRSGLKVEPLENWENESPSWWEDHNELKHRTAEHFPKANLRNVVMSLGALYYFLNHPKAIERLGPRGTDVFVAIY